MSPTTTTSETAADRVAARNRERIATAPPQRVSPWTTRQKLVRVAWETVGRVLWCVAPGSRPSLLRLFGARVGRRCRFARSVEIVIPWNLTIGDDVVVGDHVVLYALGPIDIANGVVLDTRAHLCAGSHDIGDPRFPQTRPPISIGRDTYLGIDTYVAPGVTIGERCRVHPRSSVFRDAPDDAELRGNPARRVTAPRSRS